MAIFVVSVFPEPLSPLITTLWLRPPLHMALYAASAVRNTCGSAASAARPLPPPPPPTECL